MFGEIQIVYPLAGFELTTTRFIVTPLSNCTTLLGDNNERNNLIITLSFIVYFNKKYTSKHGSAPYHLKVILLLCKFSP